MTYCWPCDLCIQDSGETKTVQVHNLLTSTYFLLINSLSDSFWYNNKIVYIYNYNNTIMLSIIFVCLT